MRFIFINLYLSYVDCCLINRIQQIWNELEYDETVHHATNGSGVANVIKGFVKSDTFCSIPTTDHL